MRLIRERDFSVIFLVVILALVAMPVFTHVYLYHDSWTHLTGGAAACGNYPMATWFAIMGRYLGGLILCNQFHLVHTISEAWRARITTVAAQIFFAVLLYEFLRRESLGGRYAAIVAYLVAVLPGCLVFVSWIGAAYIQFGYVTAMISGLLCQAMLRRGKVDRIGIGLILSAIAIAFMTDLIYQSCGMFLLVVCGAAVASAVARNNLKGGVLGTVLYSGVGVVANSAYFVWFKFISGYAPLLAKDNPSRGIFFHDIGGTITWFYQAALPRAAELWFFPGSRALEIAGVAIFLLVFLFFVITKIIPKADTFGGAIGLTVAYGVLMAALAVGSIFPYLVSNMRLELLRTLMPLSAFLLIVTAVHLWFLVGEQPKVVLVNSATLVASVVTIVAYNSMLLDLVLPRAAETQTVMVAMKAASQSGKGSLPVHLIIPDIATQSDTDEYGALSVNFPQDRVIMVNDIRHELGLPWVAVTASKPGQPFKCAGTVVVDLRPLANDGVAPFLRAAAIPETLCAVAGK